jgi:hypothetical protein
MNRTAVRTLQTIWDCRFSRPGHQLTTALAGRHDEPLWTCIRDGRRRAVTEEECEDCPHWQLYDARTRE